MTVIYFRFDQEHHICLLASIFVFSSCLLISVDISISCQDIGKEMFSKDGVLSLKIVSEQSTISGRVNWEYFVVLRRRSLSQFWEKIQKLKVIFEGKCLQFWVIPSGVWVFSII